jgi:C_GCAxxG_C_C family probable redox protein
MNETKANSAVKCFVGGFNCSQAMVSTFGPQFGLDPELALRTSSPFGAGMGRMGATCGAVTGAFMVLGLRFGRTRIEDKDAQENVYKLVTEFVDSFKKRNGSISCRDLIGYDLATPEGLKLAREEGIFRTRCPKFVKDSGEILEKLLQHP